MTRIAFIASTVALALGITVAHATHPLMGLPFLFVAAFCADLYLRRRATGKALRKARARASLAERTALPPAAAPEFTPCCHFWSSSAGQVHASRCRTRRTG